MVIGSEDTDVGALVNVLREGRSGLVSREVDTEGGVVVDGEDIVVVEVHTSRFESVKVPCVVPVQTEDVTPVGVRLGRLDVGLLISTFYTKLLLYGHVRQKY